MISENVYVINFLNKTHVKNTYVWILSIGLGIVSLNLYLHVNIVISPTSLHYCVQSSLKILNSDTNRK